MLLRSSQVRTGHLQPVEPEFEPEHNCEHEHEHHHMSPRPPRSRRRRAMHTTRRGSQSLSTPLLIISVFVLLSSHCFQQPVFAVCARRLQQQIYDQLQQEHHQSPPPSSHFASSSSSSSSSFSLLHSSLRPLFPLSSSTSSSSKNATLSFQCPSILPHDFPSFSSSSSDPLSDSALLSLSRNVSTLFALLLLPAGTCTATRVGHRYLLTAAQCLRDFNASGTSADYRVLFANVSSEKVVYSVDGGRVKAFRRHPKFRDPLRFARQGYSVHDRYKKYDVAWLRLARVKKKNGNRNNNKPRQPSNRRPFHDPPQGDPNNNSSSSTSPSFFTTLNRHPDLPSPGSTVRIAGFGRYSGFIEGEYSYYSDDVEDGVDWKDPRFYEARQVDMKVLGNRFKQCRYPPGYNESSQICVGYGDENEKYYPADFDLKCNPCGLDAGGPVFQYTPGFPVPVLLGIISVPRSSGLYCNTPYSHIRLSTLFSVPGFLPSDFAAGLTLVTPDSPERDLPVQTAYPVNATKGYAYEDSNGRYDDNDPERWRAAAIVLGCLVGVALIGLVALAVVVWKMKKGAAETGNGERAEEEQQQQQVNNEQTAADMEQNVTPQDIIAPE